MERTNAFREQAQATTGRLVRVVGDVRDRTDRILTECRALVDDVVQDLAEEGQGQAVPGDPEEEPGRTPKRILKRIRLHLRSRLGQHPPRFPV